MSNRVTRSAARRSAAASSTRPDPVAAAAEPPRTPKRRKVAKPAPAAASSSTARPATPPAQQQQHQPAAAAEPVPQTPHAAAILAAEKRMSDALSGLKFAAPVTHVYNPLEYAWDAHAWYVRRYAKRDVKMLLIGMNPGPWGMAQTGVPFGEVAAMRDFLHMPDDTTVNKPTPENAARPVDGLSCKRSEVSGKRLWREWAATRYASADAFFADAFVYNYCPLMMMEQSGRNRTPVQLKAAERKPIHAACDIALRDIVAALRPRAVVGIGGYATDRCKAVLADHVDNGLVITTLLHPSPASPAANRGWVDQAVVQIEEIGKKIEASDFRWE